MTWFLTSLSLVVLSFMQVESINSIICLFVSFSTGDSSLTKDDAYNFRIKKAGPALTLNTSTIRFHYVSYTYIRFTKVGCNRKRRSNILTGGPPLPHSITVSYQESLVVVLFSQLLFIFIDLPCLTGLFV